MVGALVRNKRSTRFCVKEYLINKSCMLGPNVMIIPTWNLTRADVTCTSSGESRRRVAWFCSCSMMSLRLVAGGLSALDIRREVRNAHNV